MPNIKARLKPSPVSSIPRRSRYRLLKKVKHGVFSAEEINFIPESSLTTEQMAVANNIHEDREIRDDHTQDWPSCSLKEMLEPDSDHCENYSNLNKQEKLLLINAFLLKHCLTKDAVEDLLTLLKFISPSDTDIPGSHFLLKKSIQIDQNHCTQQNVCNNFKSHADQISEKRNNSIIATQDNKIWLIQKLVYVNFAGGVGVVVAQRVHGLPDATNI
ncbi:unnamed protein product [Allacma fusca]|uniref:Uncharacterized protein n=1 Tax=Allacma fusca TaxID=39272 RepID=A0A8J2JX59_9HEXA|nr:unnamed protein product [Allacma fusca]